MKYYCLHYLYRLQQLNSIILNLAFTLSLTCPKYSTWQTSHATLALVRMTFKNISWAKSNIGWQGVVHHWPIQLVAYSGPVNEWTNDFHMAVCMWVHPTFSSKTIIGWWKDLQLWNCTFLCFGHFSTQCFLTNPEHKLVILLTKHVDIKQLASLTTSVIFYQCLIAAKLVYSIVRCKWLYILYLNSLRIIMQTWPHLKSYNWEQYSG